MISKTTYWAINYVVNSGFWLGVMPFKWNRKKKRLKLIHSSTRYIHILFSTGHIIGRIVAMFYFFISIGVRSDIPTWEIICGMFVMSLLLLTVFIQILALTMGSSVETIMNSALDFQDKLLLFFKVNEKDKNQRHRNGLEKIVLIALYAPTILTFMGGAGIYMLLDQEVMRILSAFKTLRVMFYFVPGFYGILALGAMYAILYDLKTLLSLLFVLAIFVNCTSNLLRLHVCPSSGITVKRKRSMQILYRAYQILHTFACEVSFVLIPVGLFIASLLMMTSFYSSVVLYHVENYLLAIVLCVAGSITCYAGKVISSLAIQTTVLSVNYISSFRKYDKYISKKDKSFFKSCRPLVWRVGSFMDIKESTYPIIMKDVVMNGVINLLLTFRPGAAGH